MKKRQTDEAFYAELADCFSGINPRDVREHVHQLIINHPRGMEIVIRVLQNHSHPVTNRAAWAIDNADEKKPGLAKPFLAELVEILEADHYSGVYRSIARLLERYEIPEALQGRVVDISFRFLNAGDMPVAVKCHAMQIIFGLLPQYPELKGELRESLLFQVNDSSAGFKSRARRILSALGR